MKHGEVDGEKQRHAIDQADAVHPRRKCAVRRHGQQQDQRLRAGGIALHLGAALAENQRFAHGLQQVVRSEKTEHVGGQQQRARSFARADVGDDTQPSVQ